MHENFTHTHTCLQDRVSNFHISQPVLKHRAKWHLMVHKSRCYRWIWHCRILDAKYSYQLEICNFLYLNSVHSHKRTYTHTLTRNSLLIRRFAGTGDVEDLYMTITCIWMRTVTNWKSRDKINAMQLGWCLFQSYRKFSCQMNAITCR